MEVEIEESASSGLLFRDYNFENTETVLPLVRKCLSKSRNETEFVRALEIALCFCLKNFPPDELEEELFEMACPAAKNFVLDKIKNLEKNPGTCFEHLGVVLKVIAYFQGVFEYLSETGKRSLLEVRSLLTATSDILYICYCHCKTSEEVYGTYFNSATECLSNFFKNCCSLQEQLLDFISEKSECDTEDDREILLLDEVLNHLSKSGTVLIHLEVKTMAKVWKTFAGLVQRYTLSLRNNHSIDETIRELCHIITSKMETALCKDTQDIPKIVKLSCFFLKLIIKFCEVFKGCLKHCQNAILNLLLLLCRCSTFPAGGSEQVLNQLAVGIDPLMSQLMEDKLLVKECCNLSKNSDKCQLFSLLCSLILKKLIDSNGTIRNLWFNENENILQWIFHSASSSQFILCSDISLPTIIVKGNHKKFTDLYEYLFVSTSAFLMTATPNEYRLIETTLLQNLLQQHPIRALLAIDLWCLLARFAGPDLCFSQIVALGNFFQQLRPGTHRPEKCYLRSLIRRLFPLLAQRHRTAFLEAFPPSFHSALWLGSPAKALTQSEAADVLHSLLCEVDRLPGETGRRGGAMCERVSRLWRFDCEVLSSSGRCVRFLKIISAVTAAVVSEMSPELLYLVLSQMKNLLDIGQATSVTLYFTWILSALAPHSLPPSSHQQAAVTAIGHIFRALLSSREAPAKANALSAFLSFARLTSHGEIIPLSVQGAPALRVEVADWLKGRVPSGGERLVGEYLAGAFGGRWEHVCEGEERVEGCKRKRVCCGDAEGVAMRWREEGRRVMECFGELSEGERRKIKAMCSSILSL